MTTTSAAEKLAGPSGEKKEEKVEKRRALGRGLASLLPGPRVVVGQPSVVSRQPSVRHRFLKVRRERRVVVAPANSRFLALLGMTRVWLLMTAV